MSVIRIVRPAPRPPARPPAVLLADIPAVKQQRRPGFSSAI
jgi:hypothetical protein